MSRGRSHRDRCLRWRCHDGVPGADDGADNGANDGADGRRDAEPHTGTDTREHL